MYSKLKNFDVHVWLDISYVKLKAHSNTWGLFESLCIVTRVHDFHYFLQLCKKEGGERETKGQGAKNVAGIIYSVPGNKVGGKRGEKQKHPSLHATTKQNNRTHQQC